ncbi:hypothetical protein K9U39_03100 [Rhodoblastus acidophilus]|uniref:Chromosome partition protein Smc n=1 Tax=Candidatus Rhodoblastus alkanivorans TaxID=2954117 RepID=A0ABS9Z621_9HYPH|nr:hypothetical protein [Candidatus Rhodoblastus alkanivorans]MCI4677631.1 hypothetical protein [Candidatus Rhodoblastus alkanivorans]MCI4682637.1 hypothetical protein [Candidatus Rhodoblastus alkanivorans]MDI4639943.1 hypothetical protein [Rhodoblastus acidophilus]
MIEEPRLTAERIAASLAIDAGNNASVEADIDCFVDEAHRHHQSDLDALLTDPGVSSWLKGAYRSLVALQRNPNDPSALTKLDGIREAFNTAAIHVGAPLLAEKERRVGELAAALADRDERMAGLEPALADRDERVAGLEDALTDRDRGLAASKKAIARRDALIARLEKALAERNKFASGLAQQLAAVRANPIRAQYDLFVYRIFMVLLRFRFWMTPRFAEKCTNSANKRNPLRSIGG